MNKMTFISSLGSQNYLPVNRALLQAVGINPAIYLSELCNYYLYFVSRNQLDSDGMFYVTHEAITKRTTLTGKQQRLCENTLRKMGVLTIKRKGVPARNWYNIEENKLLGLLTGVSVDYYAEVGDIDDVEDEESAFESDSVQFAQMGNQEVTKGNIKIDQMGKLDVPKGNNKFAQMGEQDVTKGNDLSCPLVTSDAMYYIKENRKRIYADSLPDGSEPHENTENYDDVFSPSDKKPRKRRTISRPTSVEEVEAFVKEKNLPVDAKFFFDYYNDSDWYDSEGKPVLNWKQKLHTWAQKNAAKSKPSPSAPAEQEELPKNFTSACSALGLPWGELHELGNVTRELGRWRRASSESEAFMKKNPDAYGVITNALSFWKSYLSFLADLIGTDTPREGHFRVGSKTHRLWCDEMGIKGGLEDNAV